MAGIFSIKKYNDNYFKIVNIKCVSDIVKNKRKVIYDKVDLDNYNFDTYLNSINDKKLLNNISRAKTNIFEISLCNEWDWFFTGTISSKYDRTNFDLYYKKFSKFINNYKRKNNLNISYLLVPELHQDNESWHIHGLLKNLDNKFLENKIVFDKKRQCYRPVKVWTDYSNVFGICTLIPCRNGLRLAKYVTKYITKDIDLFEKTKHLYYCSRGLNRASLHFRAFLLDNKNFKYDYYNSYVNLKYVDLIGLKKFLRESGFTND